MMAPWRNSGEDWKMHLRIVHDLFMICLKIKYIIMNVGGHLLYIFVIRVYGWIKIWEKGGDLICFSDIP